MQWNEKDSTITKTFEFSSYLDGIDFVNEVANLSEQENHHPDITVGYCKVTISLTTHDAGSLTEKDFKLAKLIDDLNI
jgi:4a-hydroxytetrahydrobiopterin dehydratase|tara:strand:- start:2802 stop:3035 length:234 start_codon:yes stop_codon:yes gene_type:complete